MYGEVEASFCSALKSKWKKAEERGVLRYVLRIEYWKILDGKYRFLTQLNINRGEMRRSPQNITSMSQRFDPARFNFTKLPDDEILMDFNTDGGDIIAVNNSPLEKYHSLLITERFKCLPQVATKYSVQKAIELFSLIKSADLRVVFNSLCALASVNHLHWHLYFLKHRMLLETIELEEFSGPVYVLNNYPGKGFCIKLSCLKSVNELVDWTYFILDYFQRNEVAHNVFVTRAASDDTKDKFDDIRVYVWARKSFTGIKDTSAFVVAACELFGHVSIHNEETYKNLTEDTIANVLTDITEETFTNIREDIYTAVCKKMNNSPIVSE